MRFAILEFSFIVTLDYEVYFFPWMFYADFWFNYLIIDALIKDYLSTVFILIFCLNLLYFLLFFFFFHYLLFLVIYLLILLLLFLVFIFLFLFVFGGILFFVRLIWEQEGCFFIDNFIDMQFNLMY
jgi:hypothetical protein